MSDNNKSTSNYEETGNKVKSAIGVVGSGLEATAKDEQEKFVAYYKMGFSSAGTAIGGALGLGSNPLSLGVLVAGSNWLRNKFAEFSSNFIYKYIQDIGITNPKLTSADIKLAEALFDESKQRDSTQSNRQDRISCLQPTLNLANKNIPASFKSAISSKITQTPKDNQFSIECETTNLYLKDSFLKRNLNEL